MLIGFVGLVVLSAVTSPASTRDLCTLGRVVLSDLPQSDLPGRYIETNSDRAGLLALCPQLRHDLPRGYAAADDDARSRAREHVPTFGPQRPTASIYTIGVPSIAQDGRSATVSVTYECSGLCGGEFVIEYRRTPTGWRMHGKPRTLYVS